VIDPADIAPGLRVSTLPGAYTGTVTRVLRSRWRHQLREFWIRWDHADGWESGDALMMPGCEKYLNALSGDQRGGISKECNTGKHFQCGGCACQCHGSSPGWRA
jgi:hypothetical protein